MTTSKLLLRSKMLFVEFDAMVRFDSLVEMDYYRHGGILQMVLRNKLAQ